MSYDIYIGEARLTDDLDVVVDHRTAPGAPSFPGDKMTGDENHRHPGYSQWSEFLHAVELHDLFFARDGLMASHPGVTPLKPGHLEQISAAAVRYRQAHQATEGWCACPQCDDWPLGGSGPPQAHLEGIRQPESGYLARLTWLEWWVGWALENCQRPALVNH